ncbi:hypothetical protein H0H92_014938, partial [Tricholoma furcatifolium]
MGQFITTPDLSAQERSDLIDLQLEEENTKLKRECRVLLLGLAGSGKSTIVKHMKLHQGGYTPAELLEHRPTIYRNLIHSAQALLQYMRDTDLNLEYLPNRALVDGILNYRWESDNCEDDLDSDVATAIYRVWTDPVIPRIMDEHSGKFHLMDSAPYFFAQALRIGTPGYQPNDTDILHAHQKSHGIVETCIVDKSYVTVRPMSAVATMSTVDSTSAAEPTSTVEPMANVEPLCIRIIDVSGQKNNVRKWIHCFEGVTSVLFCTALSDYDQVLEKTVQNRMSESLTLFEAIINSRWFIRTSIILFLNKIDIFKSKLAKVPLERHFPGYTGGADINKAAKYILWEFLQMNRARLHVYP